MKIVCDACGTKYSIADDRVAGKVFKIRCKKCSQIVVVRGGPVEVAEPAPELPAGEWHLAIDGEQSGPFERAELIRRHAAGELDDDTLVWRDGMDEWVAFASIPELADGTARPAPAPTAAAQDAMFSTRSVEAFAGEAGAPAAGDAKTRLLAERNESSVLFTLGNLARLASTTPSAKDAPAAKPGAAGGEGSGLIDIRALAGTFAPKAGAARPVSAVGSLDDLPTFGPAFGEPIAMTMMPVAARATTDRKMLVALFAALAMLALVGTILLVVMLRGDRPAQAATESPAPRVASREPAATPPASPTTNPAIADAPAPPPATSTPATTTTATTPPPPPTTTPPPPTTTTRTRRPPPTTTTTRPPPTTTTTRPPPVTTTTTTTRTTAPDKVQCEFSGYADKGCEIYKPATTTTAAASNLPENLDRGAIAAGLATIRAQGCGNKSSARGDVAVQIKVNAEGGVSSVTVKSSPDPALSTCVVAAAQKGTFAKTKRGASFGYVWRY